MFFTSLLLPVVAGAATYTWTGAVSGDWNDAGNWDTNGVPVDTNPGTSTLELDVSVDRIVIDASGSANAVPTNVPAFGGGWGSAAPTYTPQVDLIYGTMMVPFAGQGVPGSGWTTTVGDGDLNNGTATLNYIMSLDMLNRHERNHMDFTVEVDGAMHISNPGSVLQFGHDGNDTVSFTVGGTLEFTNAVQLDVVPDNYFVLTEWTASVTAGFGGSYTNLAAVQARIGDGLDFRSGGADPDKLILYARDNKDNTFTVRPKPPLGTVISLY